jgi:hypothetical protein
VEEQTLNQLTMLDSKELQKEGSEGDSGGTHPESANHAGLYRELQKAVMEIAMLDCEGKIRKQ